MIAPLARRDRDLPGARGHVREHRARRAGRADRERAGRRRDGGDAGAGARPCARRSGSTPSTPSCSTPARSRRIRGSICCSPRWRSSLHARPDARLRARRRQARSGRRAHAQARAAGHRRPCRSSPASGRRARFRRICWRGRRARLAAQSRGTNTPLKIYQYLRSGRADRRDAAADAHAGARRRHRRSSPARRRQEFADGILRALDDPAAAARDRRRARRARRDEVQLRGLSRRARGRRCAALGADRRRARPGAPREGRGVTERRPRPLQLHDLRRSGDGRRFDERAVRRADRRAACAETQARVLANFVGPLDGRGRPRRRHRHRPRGAAARRRPART